jgi:hypothetical protein
MDENCPLLRTKYQLASIKIIQRRIIKIRIIIIIINIVIIE